jgi:hypothetical protein
MATKKKLDFFFFFSGKFEKMENTAELLKPKFKKKKKIPGCYLGQSLWPTNQTHSFPLIGPIGGHCIMAIILYKSKTGFHTIRST